jgi:hypothetical protein
MIAYAAQNSDADAPPRVESGLSFSTAMHSRIASISASALAIDEVRKSAIANAAALTVLPKINLLIAIEHFDHHICGTVYAFKKCKISVLRIRELLESSICTHSIFRVYHSTQDIAICVAVS